LPKPSEGETEKDFVGRCVPIVIHEGTAKDPSQAAAICYSIWREHHKMADESFSGLSVQEPEGIMIIDGQKKWIVKNYVDKQHIEESLLLLQGDYALGIIRISNPSEIKMTEFEKKSNLHMITEEEKNILLADAKMLYAYPIQIMEKFDNPRKITIPVEPQTFSNDVRFCEEETKMSEETAPAATAPADPAVAAPETTQTQPTIEPPPVVTEPVEPPKVEPAKPAETAPVGEKTAEPPKEKTADEKWIDYCRGVMGPRADV
jgi:hypothetical protein